MNNNHQSNAIKLEKIIPTSMQIALLYDLLNSRAHSISHQKPASLSDHTNFVKNHPYRAWFLITCLDAYIGTVYVSDSNTIGVNLIDAYIEHSLGEVIAKIQSKYEPLPPIASVRSGSFAVNVPSSHDAMISKFNDLGYQCIQVTFALK